MENFLTFPDEIFSLYGLDKPGLVATHNTSRGDSDLLMTYIVEFAGKGRYAVKVTRNAFTTPETRGKMG